MFDHYSIKYSMFLNTPVNERSIIFLGDSLTEYLMLDELLPGHNVLNRGIAGDTTAGVLQRIDEVIRHKPAKIFLLIGTNDIALCTSEREITGNIREIVSRIQQGTPETVIYLQTLIPVNSRYMGHRHNMKIEAVNETLRIIAGEKCCVLVDLHGIFAENGELPMKYSVDGLHLNGEGAVKWIDFLKPMI